MTKYQKNPSRTLGDFLENYPYTNITNSFSQAPILDFFPLFYVVNDNTKPAKVLN